MKTASAKSKKHRLGFDQRSWVDTEEKIRSAQTQMNVLASLIKEAGIKNIDVAQLIRDPYNTILPHMPESFQRLAESLSAPDLLNWERFPVYRDIVKWSRRNSTNIELINYHSYYKLNGKAVVDETKFNELKEKLTRYTETERQALLFEKISQAKDLLNEAQEIAGHWIDPYSSNNDLVKPFSREGTKYTVNENFILTY